MSIYIIHNENTHRIVFMEVGRLPLDKKWEVRIKEYKSNKTLEQNNTYWQWVDDIGNHLGNFKNEQDFDLRWMHLPPIFRDVQGKTVETRKTISQLKVDEMRKYMDRVSTWASSEGIPIRMPEDLHAHS